MNGIHIVATGSALPKRTVTNHDLSKIVDTSDEWIVTRTGIESRHICEEETGVSLAIEAAKAAIDEALAQAMVMGEDTETMSKEVFSIEEIGAVVVATATPDYAFPSNACLVQKALNLPKETMAFDLSAACSGFLYGMEVCRGLLRGSKKKYALLIGSEQLSRIVDFTDRSTCILFGDGAGAAILRLDDSLYVHKAWADTVSLFSSSSCFSFGFSVFKADCSSVTLVRISSIFTVGTKSSVLFVSFFTNDSARVSRRLSFFSSVSSINVFSSNVAPSVSSASSVIVSS